MSVELLALDVDRKSECFDNEAVAGVGHQVRPESTSD